jgi:hypothetical protein
MAYDEQRKNVVWFGSNDSGLAGVKIVAETWIWDGIRWTKRSPHHVPPRPDSMTYAPAIGRLVLLAGATTWTWDGSDWVELVTSPSPSARSGPILAYDFVNQQVVMYGGRGPAFPMIETWVLNLPSLEIVIRPTALRRVNPPGGSLPVAILSTETFDAASQVERGSLTFGATGDEHTLVACEPGSTPVRLDGQAVDALLCYFRALSARPVVLKGKTTDAIPFFGQTK